MDYRTPLGAVGAAVTTFLLVTVTVIELVAVEFSALVALPLGLLAGLGALMAVVLHLTDLPARHRRLLFTYATFGPAVLLVLGLSYVNVGRNLFTVPVAIGVGVVATAAVYVALSLTDVAAR